MSKTHLNREEIILPYCISLSMHAPNMPVFSGISITHSEWHTETGRPDEVGSGGLARSLGEGLFRVVRLDMLPGRMFRMLLGL